MSHVLTHNTLTAPILIVDNEQPQAKWVASVAEEAGFDEIQFARDELAAYQIIDREGEDKAGIAFAVVDIMLSDSRRKEGLRVIERLRQKWPKCRIIALTSKGTTQIGVEALRRGATDFVCADLEYVNWQELLLHRLQLWRGVSESETAVCE